MYDYWVQDLLERSSVHFVYEGVLSMASRCGNDLALVLSFASTTTVLTPISGDM